MAFANDSRPGSAREVFAAFLKLGLTSFGGPIAHLGYFRDEFVLRRRWIDETGYADIVALCQFLPGPASSQVGFVLGLRRAGGLAGGIAAWLGFTLPSAVILLAFALASGTLSGALATGCLHGLKLVAVVVVAQALFGMARSLTPDIVRAIITASAASIVLLSGNAFGQIAAIGMGAALGSWLCRGNGASQTSYTGKFPITRRAGAFALIVFAALLTLPPLVAAVAHNPELALFDAFYRSGALVFGGGHVVLPLLQAQVVSPGWVSDAAFLNGYGAAQAVPGPLFAFAAYLGALATPMHNAPLGAMIALIGLFLPGLLLVYGALPFWNALRARPLAQSAMRGANAAVVGILAVAFVDPVCTTAILRWYDAVPALAGFLLLVRWKLPPWIVVVLLAATGAATSLLLGTAVK
ncbi:MAG: chromate efflux transporter [Proteobacteria bacterium]|uniref:chromate efflux transporter n=1 Tax=Rudaea sp. TaxID=2136325 RepID=UPI0037830498|nr:chromate efflux transporter [Pseudomonadota bacterium]